MKKKKAKITKPKITGVAQNFLDISGLPLGLRNNNPGNLRPLSGGQTWQGEIAPDTVHNFSRFSDIAYGLRAMITSVAVSIISDGNDTLTKLITRYAGPGDGNNTQSYIDTVSNLTGIGPDDPIPNDINAIISIVRAMTSVELGPTYAGMISDSDISQAVDRLSSQVRGWLTGSLTGNGLAGIWPILIAGGLAALIIGGKKLL